jgi:serine/threonine protein kinase
VNAANRERVKDLLSRAARLPPQERAAFIERAAGADRLIASEALDLLATLDDAAFLSAPTGAGLAAALPGAALAGEGPGTRIDRYKLLQLIGEGGFGSVYMAEQTEPVQRRVALKIIKAGMDTRQVIARFEAERQALAMMDHPGIARVLDAGATDGGRPYFVMELVRGEPVTSYCDRGRLPVRQRLDLFRDICNAVQHAHQKGIIHRDLKPNNVLVTVADGAPLPKVIDFGIAKATAARLTDKTLFTEMHQLIGTPEYMSPEQAEVSGVDIDTRSDVYSLGVLLYELLTGSTPLERARLRSTPLADVQRLIREEEPQRPSVRIATRSSSAMKTPVALTSDLSDPSAVEIARRRRSEPQLLTRILRGDLDWIVMKCLEKDRQRRYATAGALADDVGHYLVDQPVLATPPSRGYKLRKFAKRNKVTISALAVVFAALVLGTFGLAIGFLRATRAERIAVRRSEESLRSAGKAEAVKNFLQEMLSSVDPSKALGRQVTIREALDEAAATIESGSLRNEPEVEADLRSVIGTTFLALGVFPESERHVGAALAIRRTLQDNQGIAADLAALSEAVSAQGRYAEQESILREAINIRRLLHPGDHRELAGAMQALAASLRAQRRLDDAEPLYRAALDMRRRLFGSEHEDIAQSLNSLALLRQNKGDSAAAEPLFREALDMRRKLLGDPHPIVADALNNLANLLRAQSRFNEAEPLLREALDMRLKLLGPQHPAVAQSMNNLANNLFDLKDPVSAEPLHRGALEIWRKTLPPEHPNIAIAGQGLARSLLVREAYSEAEPLFREALTIAESQRPVDDYWRLSIRSNLGESLAGQRRFDEAEKTLLETYQQIIDKYPRSLRRQQTAARLLWLYEQWDRPQDAEHWRTVMSQDTTAGP